MTLCAPTHHIGTRGDTLGGVNLTLEITTPMEGVIRVKTYHYKGALDDAPKFELNLSDGMGAAIDAREDDDTVRIVSGRTELVIAKKDWKMTYYSDGKKVTSSGKRDLAYMRTAWKGDAYIRSSDEDAYMRQQLSGFGFWSHDIGGFESTSTPNVYKRWCAFGLLSSHSRLHGSTSYRVPWAYDEEAVDVLRFFTRLKMRLMPYLFAAAVYAHKEGIPTMRAMLLEFPKDKMCQYLDKQYLLGDSLLVAPVFNEDGVAEYYLPNDGGDWTDFFTGEKKEGGKWYQAQCCGCKNDTRVRKYGSDGVQKHDCCRIVKALLELQGGMEDYERWQEQELNWSAKLMWCLACSRWRKKSR